MASEIRPVTADDVDQVVEFSLRAWRPVFDSFRAVLGDRVYTRVYPDWSASQAAAVRSVCLDQDMDVFVAEEAGKVVGYVVVAFHQDPPKGEIDMIAVDPDFQRRGHGAMLTSFALRHIASRGMPLATVATGGDPGHAPSRRLYEAAGFVALPLVRYYKPL
jgi:ribosomal protein S18 acetylase RimI-like enzyme